MLKYSQNIVLKKHPRKILKPGKYNYTLCLYLLIINQTNNKLLKILDRIVDINHIYIFIYCFNQLFK